MMLSFVQQVVLGLALLVLMIAGYAIGMAVEAWETRRRQRRRIRRMAGAVREWEERT